VDPIDDLAWSTRPPAGGDAMSEWIARAVFVAVYVEGVFWLVAMRFGTPGALVGLVALVAVIWVCILAERRRLRRAVFILEVPAAAPAPVDAEIQTARRVMEALAAEAAVPVPDIRIDEVAATSGGADTWLDGGRTLVRVSPALAGADERDLRAILAHELGHAVNGRSLALRVGPVGWAFVLAALYAPAAAAAPILLLVPKASCLLAGGTIGMFLTNRFDERVADRFAVGLTGDPDSLRAYLARYTSRNWLFARIHRSRVRAIEG
jgi:Zn-dependent protease with chaperone function